MPRTTHLIHWLFRRRLHVPRVERLFLYDNDIVILRYPGALSRDEVEWIRQMWLEQVSPHRLVVLDRGAELGVLGRPVNAIAYVSEGRIE